MGLKKIMYCQYGHPCGFLCSLAVGHSESQFQPGTHTLHFIVTKSIFKGILDSCPLKRAKADISLTQHSLSAILIMWCKLANHATQPARGGWTRVTMTVNDIMW